MKKELLLFEQMGGTYTEIDGVLYPNLVLKPEKNAFVGKVGNAWMRYMEENHPMRVFDLVWKENFG